MTDGKHSGVQAYIAGTLNEFRVGRRGTRELDFGTVMPFPVPRPYKVHYRLRRIPRLHAVFWRVLCRVWWWVLPLAMLVEACVLAVRRAFSRGPEPVLRGRVGVVLSHRLPDVAARLPPDEIPSKWVTFPGVQKTTLPAGGTAVSFTRLVRFGDLLWALPAAWQGARAAAHSVGGPCGRLFVYTAYRWFVVWRVLERSLEGCDEVWFSNHFDRWALLLDRLPRAGRKVLVQHGILPEHSFPALLHNISTVYSFPEEEKRKLRELLAGDRPRAEFRQLPTALELKPVQDDEGRPTVLVVGQPVDPEKECRIALELHDNIEDVKVYVKPHPLFSDRPYSGLRAHPEIELITDRHCYPDVDVVVYLSSTLGLEYSAAGIPTICHQSLDPQGIVRAVRNKLAPDRR